MVLLNLIVDWNAWVSIHIVTDNVKTLKNSKLSFSMSPCFSFYLSYCCYNFALSLFAL